MAVQTITQPVRGCGRRKEYGLYLETSQGTSEGVFELFNIIDPPVSIHRGAHRGFLIVDGSKILRRMPEEEWYQGASKDTIEKKRADSWAIDTFGMTLTKRTSLGECEFAETANEAYSLLEDKVKITSTAPFALLELTNVGIEKYAPSSFASLVQSLKMYNLYGGSVHLIKATASTWRIMEEIPPSKRQDYRRPCMLMLASLGLAKDSLALGRIYAV
jgi:hypothetical protein